MVAMKTSALRKFALWLLAGCGIFQIGMGLFFIGLRPTMLPEDERFIGLTLDALAQVSPSLPLWLNRVFVVLGGHIVATGLLIVLTAILVWRHRENLRTAVALTMAAGLASIVLMSAVNFAIHSDFRWLLLLPALAWTVAVLLLAIESRKPAEGQ
jgi:hypothetical protein